MSDGERAELAANMTDAKDCCFTATAKSVLQYYTYRDADGKQHLTESDVARAINK
jgi:hypothetical protein